MPQYFTNLRNPKEGDVVTAEKLELHIPEGFLKQLSYMEKDQLLNEQLAEYGLKQGSISHDGCIELIKTQKIPAPLKVTAGISDRLKEYLHLFYIEQEKNKYQGRNEITKQVDDVIDYICTSIKQMQITNAERLIQALSELIKARDTLIKINKSNIKTCELVKELKSREGVEEITVESYATSNITVEGPAIILKVID